jgi:16S rRNA (uracil1498-N3)-methyltransferase
MRRFYLPPAACKDDTLLLTDREAHHGAQVLRLQSGDEVTVLDGAGTRLICAVKCVSRKIIELSVRSRQKVPQAGFEVTLFQSIVKGKAMETIVEKATELGVSRVVPLITERVVSQLDAERSDSKQAKWQLIAIESIKQCGSPWLPQIDAPQTLNEVLNEIRRFDMAFVASLRDGRHIRQWVQTLCPTGAGREQAQCPTGRSSTLNSQPSTSLRSGCVWIGPEGDFTNAELDAIEASGAKPITLGPLVLRADTAAIASLAVLRSEIDWLSATAPAP